MSNSISVCYLCEIGLKHPKIDTCSGVPPLYVLKARHTVRELERDRRPRTKLELDAWWDALHIDQMYRAASGSDDWF